MSTNGGATGAQSPPPDDSPYTTDFTTDSPLPTHPHQVQQATPSRLGHVHYPHEDLPPMSENEEHASHPSPPPKVQVVVRPMEGTSDTVVVLQGTPSSTPRASRGTKALPSGVDVSEPAASPASTHSDTRAQSPKSVHLPTPDANTSAHVQADTWEYSTPLEAKPPRE